MLFQLISIVFSWVKWTQKKWFVVILFLLALILILWIHTSIHPYAILSSIHPYAILSDLPLPTGTTPDPGPWS